MISDRQFLVTNVSRQLQPHDAVDLQNRRVTVVEEDHRSGVGAKYFGGLGNSGTDDLVGIEGLSDLTGEPVVPLSRSRSR